MDKDKTVKLHAFSETPNSDALHSNLTDEQNKSFELAKKAALYEDEKKKSLEYLKMVEQLKESLVQEKTKSAELVKKLSALDVNELANKNALLEEEKKKNLEYLSMIERLSLSSKQEQVKSAEMAKMVSELEARVKEISLAGANQLAEKDARITEEKSKSLALAQTIERAEESLKHEQAKLLEMSNKAAEQEVKAKELSELLNKIAGIAAAGKAG